MRNPRGSAENTHVARRSGVAGLFAVPKLEDVAADPRVAGVLDAHTAMVLESTAIAALLILHNRRLALAEEREPSKSDRKTDRLLTPKELAERIGFGLDWVYHNHKKFPFSVYINGEPRFSEKSFEDFIRSNLNWRR